MAQRPFKILGIQQIAIGGPSKDKLKTLWVDMLGLEVTGNFVSERENVDEDICAMGVGPFKVEVDLMQPLDPDKKPAVHTTPAQPRRPVGGRPAQGGRMARRQRRALRPRRHPPRRRRLRHHLPASQRQRTIPDRRRGRAGRTRPGPARGGRRLRARRGLRRPLHGQGFAASAAPTGSRRDGFGRSAGRREGGDGNPHARRGRGADVRGFRRSYRRQARWFQQERRQARRRRWKSACASRAGGRFTVKGSRLPPLLQAAGAMVSVGAPEGANFPAPPKKTTHPHASPHECRFFLHRGFVCAPFRPPIPLRSIPYKTGIIIALMTSAVIYRPGYPQRRH
jgi:hypothetical protein